MTVILYHYQPFYEGKSWYFLIPGKDGPPGHSAIEPIKIGPYVHLSACCEAILAMQARIQRRES
jgi:hypothetical protein